MTKRLAVFASGGGSNLQALIDYFATDPVAAVSLVVSDRADSRALERAREAGIAADHIPVSGRSSEDVAHEMLHVLTDSAIDIVALAGYLKLVPAAVTAAFRGRMLNIHPALLPAFGGPGMYGRRVHAAVLAAGCTVTGATVHLVDERYDEGRIVAQWPVPVLPGDSVETLAARVLHIEHRLYPAAIAALARRSAAQSGGADRDKGRAGATGAPGTAGDNFRLAVSLDGIDNEIIGLADL